MNKWFGILAFLFVLAIGTSFQAQALTFDHLPKNQTSKQWSVQVGKADHTQHSVKPKKGVYDTYSFKVKNIGMNVDSVTVQAFRNEPNSKTKFALVSGEASEVMLKQTSQEFKFSVFPLAVKATELEIVVTWKEKGVDRALRETFVFKQQKF
ncbi:hypothetical protein V7157_25110 [Neobacillus drentensis]|uniref:hypothetical protein n=1 Tax=Neobacillus drentensis TaxID=220684 RepID=UPI00300135A9